MAFSLPDGLAAACLGRLGVDAPVDVAGASHLLDRLAATMPTGSTAKLEAMAAGRVPPGADARLVAETWLARPGLAWSCWAIAAVYAALVAAGGALTAAVLGARRVDPLAPPVDFHSVVELGDGTGRWLTDPFFCMAPVAAPAGEALRPGAWGQAVADGPVWRTAVGTCAGRNVLRYRTFTAPLTAGDVEALCRVSVTHSGVAARPRAHLATPDGMVAAAAGRDGAIRLRRWRATAAQVWGLPGETTELGAWSEAEERVATLATGQSAGRAGRAGRADPTDPVPGGAMSSR